MAISLLSAQKWFVLSTMVLKTIEKLLFSYVVFTIIYDVIK